MEETPQEQPAKKKKKLIPNKLQLAIALLLATAALLSSYSTWMNQLHASSMSENYSRAARMTAEATETYTLAAMEYSNDMAFWGNIQSLSSQEAYRKEEGDESGAKAARKQMEILLSTYDQTFAQACRDALKKGGTTTPFDILDTDDYFTTANDLNAEAMSIRAKGDLDNLRSDSFALAQVFYSVVLFLLGLAGAWTDRKSKKVLLAASVAMLALGFAYMVSLPLPDGFNLLDYWSHITGGQSS
ncbi:MAG: hypothetical protein Q4D06_06635 [Coriobacteriia bacterium]|nr:hypothetical protein [Coriobacteriia bacterium]